jgi:anti-sigma factor RsiW
MICQETRQILDAYFDGELDLAYQLDIDGHLRRCAGCAETLRSYQELRHGIHASMMYYEASTKLKASIRSSLQDTGKAEVSLRRLNRSGKTQWFAIAASIVAVALAAAIVLTALSGSSATEVIATEVLDAHLRSMMRDHLVDVSSSDQGALKPWFAGKLDFVPSVRDLTDRGFSLMGGRVEYLNRRPVAALVFRRGQHTINLFVWPASRPDASIHTSTIQGYSLVHCSWLGVTYWAISDLNPSELRELVKYQQK